jgi:hypothetical protein
MNHNPNCCGSNCQAARGEVRVYPLGGGGNLILCFACWQHENRYRADRGRHYKRPQDWPQVDWDKAEVYGP